MKNKKMITNNFQKLENIFKFLHKYLPPIIPTIIYFTCYHLVFHNQESPETATLNCTTTFFTKLDAAHQQWLDLFYSLISYTLHYFLWSIGWGTIYFILTSPVVEVILYNLIGKLSRLLQMDPEDFIVGS